MDKVYSRIIWQNEPSSATALGATNLNKMDMAINTIDDRVVGMDTSKANQSTVNNVVQSITYNDSTGVLTITKVNDTATTIDTKLEKLAVNFSYNPATQQLDITLDDGTVQHVDLSALITQYEFMDTDTVSFSVQADGKIKASIIPGSITGSMLQPNYLADIIVQANIATTQAGVATNAAEDAMEYRDEALAAKTAAETARDQAVDISNVGIASDEHIGLVKGNGNVAVNADASMWADPYKDKATLTGPSVQFPAADDGLIEITQVKGKSTQTVTTQGKNILPSSFSEWESGEYSIAGAKITNASRVRCKRLIQVSASTSYYVSTGSTGFMLSVRTYDATGAFVSNIGTVLSGGALTTPASAVYISINLIENPDTATLTYASFQTAFSNGTIKPFICLNSESNKTYADFIPNSPSPDYPAQITSLGDSGSFVAGACGKNLLDSSKFNLPYTVNGISFTKTSDGSVILNGTASAVTDIYLISAPANALYTDVTNMYNRIRSINGSVTLSNNLGLANYFKKSDKSYVQNTTLGSNVILGFLRIASGTTFTNAVLQIQLELGSAATPYEPYKGNTITVNSGGYSLPDGTADVLDFANGKKTQNVGKAVYDGSMDEAWIRRSALQEVITTRFGVPLNEAVPMLLMNSSVDNFKFNSSTYYNDTEGYGYDSNQFVVRIAKTRLTGYSDALTDTQKVNLFKAWLTANPVTLIYKLATPVITSLSRLFLTSYKGITNVFTLDATQPEFTAVAKSELWSKTYDAKASTVSFTQAATLANIVSGERHDTLFGKIAKFFSFIGTTALTTVAQTVTGAINELVTKKADKSNTYNFDYNAFSSGTIFDWAVNADKPGIKGITGGFIPSDVPVAAEGYVEVIFIENGIRRRVNFVTYASTRIVYSRDIFNGAWYNPWTYDLNSTMLVNTDTVNDASKPLGANVGYALGQEIDTLSTSMDLMNYLIIQGNITGTQNFAFLTDPGRYTGSAYPSNTSSLPAEIASSSDAHAFEVIIRNVHDDRRVLELSAFNTATSTSYKYVRWLKRTGLIWSSWVKITN